MKPIIFSGEMVRAILDGRKTQTRRVVKFLPGTTGHKPELRTPEWPILFCPTGIKRPRYKIGDILWVRETWGFDTGDDDEYGTGSFVYKANNGEESPHGWHPSIHMPRVAARLFLRVADVRVERVQEISEADAVAEGITRMFDYLSPAEYDDWSKRVGHFTPQNEEDYTNYLWHGHFGQYGMGNRQSDAWEYQYSGYASAVGSFSSLWELINAKRGYGWNTNPWVWVYTFERIEESEALEVAP